jgi:hypothetical protein
MSKRRKRSEAEGTGLGRDRCAMKDVSALVDLESINLALNFFGHRFRNAGS